MSVSKHKKKDELSIVFKLNNAHLHMKTGLVKMISLALSEAKISFDRVF
jgi:hypothetical protein